MKVYNTVGDSKVFLSIKTEHVKHSKMLLMCVCRILHPPKIGYIHINFKLTWNIY